MAASGRAESRVVEDEFLQNLYKGGELLAAGKVIEAKDYLERAHKLQPKNEKAQNLLGLTYFKLGLFDRAAEIYETLVRDNPVDATLRVNLGLVYLKTNQLQRAIREFETAVDLAPEHKKAHNYLGLALAQTGNYAEAREHFLEAGSEAMAQKMERAMAGEATGLHRLPTPLDQQNRQKFAEIEGSEVVAERGGQPVTAPPEQSWGSHFEDQESAAGSARARGTATAAEDGEEIRFAEDEGPPAIRGDEQVAPVSGGEVEAAGSGTMPQPVSDSVPMASADEHSAGVEIVVEEGAAVETAQVDGAAEEVDAAAPHTAPGRIAPSEPRAVEATAEFAGEPVPGLPLGDLAPSLEVLQGAVASPFEVRPEGVAITVAGEMLTRVEGLLLMTGAVKFEPELKRFRGRTTEQPFGEGEGRVMRASGQGVLIVGAPAQDRFVSVDLAEESAYFREESVYAFEEAVMFENGRIPSELTGDLDLVHLRGKGKVLLRLDGALRTHQVRMDEPVTVPLGRLVGWFGNLTPKLVAMALDEGGRALNGGVELSGEGFVLFAVKAR